MCEQDDEPVERCTNFYEFLLALFDRLALLAMVGGIVWVCIVWPVLAVFFHWG